MTPLSELSREECSCAVCGSCPRYRALISLLSRELFGRSIALPDFPVRKEIVGAGMTDWNAYAARLAEKFSYTNTYYHRAPKLDITDPDPAMFGTLDFLISTEVFEHVAPPISIAFENARKLLKPDGVMIFTVPYATAPSARTVEHFPNLYQFTIEEREGRKILVNTTRAGETETFGDIVFHGGEGFALEMRLFAESSLVDEFRSAGFGEVDFVREPDFEFGVYWKEPWSKPLVVRATTRRVPISVPAVENTAPAAVASPAFVSAPPAAPAAASAQQVTAIQAAEIETLEAQVNTLQRELHNIRKTRLWRLAKLYWSFAARFRRTRD